MEELRCSNVRRLKSGSFIERGGQGKRELTELGSKARKALHE
jgi:hypothetical protein